MSDAQSDAQQPEAEALTEDSFASLLQQEFKPKSDRAKEAVEGAVATPAAAPWPSPRDITSTRS